MELFDINPHDPSGRDIREAFDALSAGLQQLLGDDAPMEPSALWNKVKNSLADELPLPEGRPPLRHELDEISEQLMPRLEFLAEVVEELKERQAGEREWDHVYSCGFPGFADSMDGGQAAAQLLKLLP